MSGEISARAYVHQSGVSLIIHVRNDSDVGTEISELDAPKPIFLPNLSYKGLHTKAKPETKGYKLIGEYKLYRSQLIYSPKRKTGASDHYHRYFSKIFLCLQTVTIILCEFPNTGTMPHTIMGSID